MPDTHLQQRLNRRLIGRRILDAFYSDEGELTIQQPPRPADTHLEVMRDDEGNGPAALHCYELETSGRKQLTVIPGSTSQ
jgi:hypothetical protein